MADDALHISHQGIEFIKREEGSRTQMYHDQKGLPTIGVGHLLTQDELSSGKLMATGVRWGDGLTEDQVTDLLGHDLDRVVACIERTVTVPLNQNQVDALCSLIFNIGTGAFAGSSLLTVLNAGHYADVPAKFRLWKYSKGDILPVLIARREREIAVWNSLEDPEA